MAICVSAMISVKALTVDVALVCVLAAMDPPASVRKTSASVLKNAVQ